MNGNAKITYHQQVSYCGKPRCRKCREGKGHGPYWYSYQTVNGHTTRTYIGKNLPPGVQAMQESVPVNRAERVPPSTLPDLASQFSTARIRIFVLGQLRLERRQQRQWQSVTDMVWQQQDVRALLGFLLCAAQRRASREQVMRALWPESDTAGESLNRVVESLRQVLDPTRTRDSLRAVPNGSVKSSRSRSAQSRLPLLHVDGDWLVLADQSQVWVDADAFESILMHAWGPQIAGPESQDDEVAAQSRERLLRGAEALYGGDFLPEERHGSWAVVRRQTLRRSHSTLLLELADLSIARRGNG